MTYTWIKPGDPVARAIQEQGDGTPCAHVVGDDANGPKLIALVPVVNTPGPDLGDGWRALAVTDAMMRANRIADALAVWDALQEAVHDGLLYELQDYYVADGRSLREVFE